MCMEKPHFVTRRFPQSPGRRCDYIFFTVTPNICVFFSSERALRHFDSVQIFEVVSSFFFFLWKICASPHIVVLFDGRFSSII